MFTGIKWALIMGGVIAMLIGVLQVRSCQLERAREAARRAQVQAEAQKRQTEVKEKDAEAIKEIERLPLDAVRDALRRGGLHD